jgi:hypothetical protein
MPSSAEESRAEVEMTPTQCNEVIEDKLSHLLPVMKTTLAIFQRVNDAMENGRINWRKALEKAKKKVSA